MLIKRVTGFCRIIVIRRLWLIGLLVGGFGLLDLWAQEYELSKKDVILIHDSSADPSGKSALIILPGLGDAKKGRKCQRRFFGDVGYDLFIPNYHDENSYEGTIRNFETFFREQELDKYGKVYVFAYILGSWVINDFIRDNGVGNISAIVYDRSPLQERAPMVIVHKIPGIGKWLRGDLIGDFSEIEYPPITNEGIDIGIIVEYRATPLIRLFRKTALGYGPIDWDNLVLKQSYDELIFTPLNHDEMYYRFDIIGEDILEFFKNSRFTDEAAVMPFDWDPFRRRLVD